MSLPDYAQHKIKSAEQAAAQVTNWQQEGKKVVFTNGCFDILHVGHVDYLAKAQALGDLLVVGVNTDRSVSELKGPGRPVNNEESRLVVLSALASVDIVVLFDDDTPLDLITKLNPDVLTKGGDYDAEESDPSSSKYIVGSAEVKKQGGEVATIPFVEGYSTTGIIDKLSSDG